MDMAQYQAIVICEQGGKFLLAIREVLSLFISTLACDQDNIQINTQYEPIFIIAQTQTNEEDGIKFINEAVIQLKPLYDKYIERTNIIPHVIIVQKEGYTQQRITCFANVYNAFSRFDVLDPYFDANFIANLVKQYITVKMYIQKIRELAKQKEELLKEIAGLTEVYNTYMPDDDYTRLIIQKAIIETLTRRNQKLNMLINDEYRMGQMNVL